MKVIKKRSIALFIFLNIITLGIYGLVVFCIMSKEINQICEGDGKHTMFYLWAMLLGFVTLFIYPLVWYYKAMERLQDNGYRYGVNVPHSGSEFLLWALLGSFLIGIGPIVSLCYFIININAYAGIAGAIQPKRYSANPIERLQIQREPFPYLDNAINGVYPYSDTPASLPPVAPVQQPPVQPPVQHVAPVSSGSITFLSGCCEGYQIPITPDAEIVIGKDPGVSQIVIGLEYARVSRKHCGVRYDANQHLYLVTDYSANGTYTTGGIRLEPHTASYLEKGTVLQLADTDNRFRLD